MSSSDDDVNNYDFSDDDSMGEAMPAELTTFLGVKLSSGESFLVEPENPGEVFKFTSVAVDPTCKDSYVTVQAEVDGDTFFLATLRPGKVDQAQLSVEFNQQAEISISGGKGPVHLVGVVTVDTELFAAYADADSEDYDGMEDDDDDEDEDDEDFIAGDADSDEEDDSEDEPKIEDVTEEILAKEAEMTQKSNKKRSASEAATPSKKAKKQQQKQQEEDSDSDDDSEDEEEEEKVEAPKKTPSKKEKSSSKAATPAKTPNASGKGSKKGTPKGKKGALSVDDMLKRLQETRNTPKKEKKFVNFASNTFRLEKSDPKIAELWQKYSAESS